MRITTDHSFHIGSQHLRGGTPCQDYALSGATQRNVSYGIISDGCSTGGKTDVGARIVALTTASIISGADPQDTIRLIEESGFQNDEYARCTLNLEPRDMLATCGYILAQDLCIAGRLIGDGVFAYRDCCGEIRMSRLDWHNNTPLYRAYQADGFRNFKASHRDAPYATILHGRTLSVDGAVSDWASNYTLDQSITGSEFYFNTEETALIKDIAIFSDGVTQVDGMDWRDVVAELLNFKSMEGDFVKRRMNRFLKNCLAHGKGPIDDISMACIHIDHEAV